MQWKIYSCMCVVGLYRSHRSYCPPRIVMKLLHLIRQDTYEPLTVHMEVQSTVDVWLRTIGLRRIWRWCDSYEAGCKRQPNIRLAMNQSSKAQPGRHRELSRWYCSILRLRILFSVHVSEDRERCRRWCRPNRCISHMQVAVAHQICVCLTNTCRLSNPVIIWRVQRLSSDIKHQTYWFVYYFLLSANDARLCVMLWPSWRLLETRLMNLRGSRNGPMILMP